MENKVHINLPENYSGEPITIHLLEGRDKDPVNMSAVNVSGTIDAVSDWLSTRTIDKEHSHIVLDPTGKKVTLVINEGHPHATTISGAITVNPELEKFGINQERRFSPTELSSLLKLNRAYFASPDTHAQILKNLKNHSADISRKINEQSDDRGNNGKSDFTTLISNIDEKFTLNMAIFKGGEKKAFEVNVCLEVRDRGISIWLESVELKEMITLLTETAFDDLKRQFTDKGYTVITK
jgi:hypothetical protein